MEVIRRWGAWTDQGRIGRGIPGRPRRRQPRSRPWFGGRGRRPRLFRCTSVRAVTVAVAAGSAPRALRPRDCYHAPSLAAHRIDGPSGVGKSATGKAVAKALDWDYLDTGAMYRSAALALLPPGRAAGGPGRVGAGARQPGIRGQAGEPLLPARGGRQRNLFADGLAVAGRALPAAVARLVLADLSQLGRIDRDTAQVIHLDLEDGAALHGLAHPCVQRSKALQCLELLTNLFEARLFLRRCPRLALSVHPIGHGSAGCEIDRADLAKVRGEVAGPEGVGEKPRQVHVALFVHRQQVAPGDCIGAGHEIALNATEHLRFVGLDFLEEGRLSLFEIHQGGGHHAKGHQAGDGEVTGEAEIVVHELSSKLGNRNQRCETGFVSVDASDWLRY